MGIANRDIKLENTLLMDLSERPVLKLCDFGYSKDELCASISKTMCGKQHFCCQSHACPSSSLPNACVLWGMEFVMHKTFRNIW